jgi:L-Ala-D/L-Glu epimerase
MQSLHISQVSIYKMQLPLYEPFIISLGTQYNADNILILLHTSEGITGYGECSPYMSINGESIDTCCIVAQYLAKALLQKNPLEIEECVMVMDKVIYGNNSIKSAFDMALYDIAAQHSQVPLWKFLGGNKNKVIVTDMTVGLSEPDKMAADAAKFKAAGFQFIKVKLGQSTEKDVARIKAIREKIGDAIPLRIDANQGWDVPTAIATLQALEQFNIEHCEEPIARWNFMQLAAVRNATSIKIMADESCSDSHDAERLAQLQACDYFNIKMGKSGGIFEALKIVSVAEKAVIKLQVGGFMESRLATTAFVHFAYASDAIVHFDFDTPLMIAEDPVTGGMQYKTNGVIEIDDTPGIGARINTDYLKKPEVVIS